MDPRSRQGYGQDEEMAYGDYHEDPAEVAPGDDEYAEGEEGERGLVGDTYRKLRGKYQQPIRVDGSNPSRPSGGGLGSFVFHKLHDAVKDIGTRLDPNLIPGTGAGPTAHSHTHTGAQCTHDMHENERHRYGSFAAQRTGSDAKWYVDGCNYMWAVSRALEQATTSVWILDCKPPTSRYLCCNFLD